VFQTRIHGRGGQGVVTAAELLASAAFDAGRHAQAFPSFGSERTGAPVVAYCRIDDQPIRTREPILAPDAIIVQDATLLWSGEPLLGVPEGAFVLVNSSKSAAELAAEHPALAERPPARVVTVGATEIALRRLGRPVPNAVLLGGFAALTGIVPLAGVQEALRARFPGGVGQANADAAAEAFEVVQEERAHAAAD
jgi:pyruvate ferredoxin oxidoreductase gamma subunit